MNPEKSQRYILLDLFRFLLASLVVLYHYFFLSHIYKITNLESSPFQSLYICGYLGVHVFFIVSGFVILHTAQKRNWSEFVKARIVRLLPGIMIVSTLGFLFSMILPNVPHTYTVNFKDFVINFLGLSIFPKINSLVNIDFVDGAMWSLRYEIGFYIIITFILLFNKIKHINIFAYAWILLSVLRNEFSVPVINKIPVNLISADYAFFFTTGILIYLLKSKKYLENKFEYILNVIFLIISIIFSIKFVFVQMQSFNLNNFNQSSPYFAVFYFLILFILFLFSINLKVKLSKKYIEIISILGGASFILYLIHQAIGMRIIFYTSKTIDWNGYLTLSLFFSAVFVSVFLHLYAEKFLSKNIKSLLSYSFKNTKSATQKHIK